MSLREDKENSQLVIDLVNMEREQLPLLTDLKVTCPTFSGISK